MSTVYPSVPRLSVRDSFDEDDLSDVDDEVFIRDGKNGGLKLDDDGGVKRPLMAPRRKMKPCRIDNSQKLPYRALLVPFCYGLLALLVLLGLIIVCIYTVNLFPVPLNILRKWLDSNTKKPELDGFKVVPCTSLASSIAWTRTFPKLTSESPFRSNDVNGDDVEDIIVGFSTGLDAIDAPEYLCDLYFDGQKPCLGGIIALDGKSGNTIWTYWTSHAIFNVDCGLDITDDGVKDCLITGRGGIFHAVDGKLGTNIWKFEPSDEIISSRDESVLDVYDATYMNDVDDDDIGDIIASHTVQSGGLRSSEILVISGKTGIIIRRVDFPKKEEIFIAPRPLLHPDGEVMLVLVSSTPEKSGGLCIISYSALIHGKLELLELYWGKGKGILLPPILTDVTSDGTEDIIVATVNSTIIAFDGLTLEAIWNYTVAGSEIISIPIPGYYNDDDVPDFMVKHQIGPGYPLYYYTLSTILDGRSGKPLLEKPVSDSMSGQMSGLSVSVDDYGNDWFLHWSSNCLKHEGSHERYRFLQGQSLLSQSRADLCKLRFNTTLVTRLWALSQHVGPPGQSLYCSEDWKNVEYNNSIDPRQAAENYIRNHPNSDGLNRMLDAGLALVSERSPRIEKPDRKISSFRHKSQESKDPDETNIYYGKNVFSNNADSESDKTVRLGFKKNPVSDENYDHYKEPKNFNINTERKSQEASWIEPGDWRDEEIRGDKQYDGLYEDNSEDPGYSAENPRIEDIREQRGLDDSGNVVFNRSDNSRNSYDPSMDYTNGGSEYSNYSPHSSLESDNTMLDDDSTETEKTRRKRPGAMSLERIVRRSSTFEKLEEKKESAEIESVFKRESMRTHDDLIIGPREKKIRVKRMSNRRKKLAKSGGSWEDESNGSRGIQRQPPTGILLPSISRSNGKTSIDLVFSTYWLPPSEVSLVLLQQDLDCIRAKHAKKLEAYSREDIVIECLAERGVDYKIYQEGMSRENFKIPLGQMTVYRMKLECVCPEDMLPGQTCKNISEQQSWPAHLGGSANGFFRPLKKPNP